MRATVLRGPRAVRLEDVPDPRPAAPAGPSSVTARAAERLAEVLDGRLDPAPVFDLHLPLDKIAEAYAAIDERRTIKPLVRP